MENHNALGTTTYTPSRECTTPDKNQFPEDARNACTKLLMGALPIYLWYLDGLNHVQSHHFLASIYLFF